MGNCGWREALCSQHGYEVPRKKSVRPGCFGAICAHYAHSLVCSHEHASGRGGMFAEFPGVFIYRYTYIYVYI